MAVYTETIELKDQVSDAAGKAAQQVSILEGAIASTENALTKAAATGNVKKYQALSKDLSAYKSALSAIPPVEEKAAATTEKVGKSAFDASNAMKVGQETIGAAVNGMKAAFSSLAQGDVKGAIAGVTDSIAGMAKMLDMVVPGLGQAVAAVIQIAGGLVGITVGLIKSGMEFAISSNQGKQAMLSMFDAMAGGAGAGAELDDMLSGLSDKIGITKDSLVPLTQGFLKMGVTGKDQLEKLTLAAISATAIVGKGGAEAFTNIQKKIALAAEAGGKFSLGTKQLLQLREAGVGVSDIADKMGMKTEALAAGLAAGTIDAKKFGDAMTEAVIKKGAGPLDKLGSSFDEIKKKFMSSIGDMFEDIDVGPFMSQVKDLFSIFGQAKPSGEAMKAGIGGFFKDVFAKATVVIPYIKHFLLDLVIYGLKAYISLKPIIAWFKELSKNQMVIDGILFAFKTIAVVIVAVVAVIAILVGILVLCNLAFGAVIIGIIWLGTKIGEFIAGAAVALYNWVAGAATAAYDFVAGLVSGIMSGGAQVVGAVTGLADKAKGAFKSALGISSPSKVMMQMGGFIGEGAASGIEASQGDVAAASSGLAGAAAGGFAGGSSGNGGKASGGVVVNIEAGAFSIQGAGKAAAEITEEMISLIFERIALAQGL